MHPQHHDLCRLASIAGKRSSGSRRPHCCRRCSKKKFSCTNFEEEHGGRSKPPAHPDRGQLRQLHPQSLPGSCPSRLHFASMSCGATRVSPCVCRRAQLSDPRRLEQMCWSASGIQPIVIRNNQGELFQALRDQQAFDNIIISPGPGSPDNLAVCCKPVCCCSWDASLGSRVRSEASRLSLENLCRTSAFALTS